MVFPAGFLFVIGLAPFGLWSRTAIRPAVLERRGQPSSIRELFWTSGETLPEAVSAQGPPAVGVKGREQLPPAPGVSGILCGLGPRVLRLPPATHPVPFPPSAEHRAVLRPQG